VLRVVHRLLVLAGAVALAATAARAGGPPNETCGTAEPIGPGLWSASTAGAAGNTALACGNSAASPDLWYVFEPDDDCVLVVDSCNSSFDTVLTIHTGCPASGGNEIACNDDADCDGDGEVDDDGWVARTHAPVTAGVPYWIRVSGYQGASGNFVLRVSCRPPVEVDDCADAVDLAEGTVFGDTTTATADGSASCATPAASPDVWYRFRPGQDCRLRASTCASALDTVLSVHAGCPGGAGGELACNDDACDGGSTVELDTTGGQSYWLRVAGANGASGPFALTTTCSPPGADAMIGELGELAQFGRVGSRIGAMMDSPVCNTGTSPLDWYPVSDGRHPFAVVNLYRIEAGRFEQIGGSWVKHGQGAAQHNACGLGCDPYPDSTHLGVGCSDTYSAFYNTQRRLLGPRSEVQPWTGQFTYAGSYLDTHSGPWNATEHMLELDDSDLDPALHPDATWIAELQIVAHDDGEPENNVGWNVVEVTGQPGGVWTFELTPSGTTLGPAVDAWSGAQHTRIPAVPSVDGQCILAARATPGTLGGWHYEYVLFNRHLDRKVRAITIPTAPGAPVRNLGFHAPPSTDPAHTNAPWTGTMAPSAVTFATGTYDAHPNTNPLRWGTAYTFRFDSDAAPTAGIVTLSLYEPGTPGALFPSTIVPGASAAAPAAGSVSEVRLGRAAGGRIALDWSPSCAAGDGDYAVYEGALGAFASHRPVLCTTGGATSATITPAAGATYYLVVPDNGVREGGYGTDGAGVARPRSSLPCLPSEALACP
jgi:hypothetical protein